MTLLNEIAALQRMRENNGSTGEVVPFIYALISRTGNAAIYIDWYSLYAHLGGERFKARALHAEFDVDLWDDMKRGFVFGAGNARARFFWHLYYRVLRMRIRGLRNDYRADC
jgi:hypothetical protein